MCSSRTSGNLYDTIEVQRMKKNVRKLWSFLIKSYYTKTRASRCKLTPLLGTQSLHVTLSMQTEHGALRHNICLANIPTSPRISALLGLWRGSVNQEDLQRKFNIAYPRQSFTDKKIFFFSALLPVLIQDQMMCDFFKLFNLFTVILHCVRVARARGTHTTAPLKSFTIRFIYCVWPRPRFINY